MKNRDNNLIFEAYLGGKQIPRSLDSMIRFNDAEKPVNGTFDVEMHFGPVQVTFDENGQILNLAGIPEDYQKVNPQKVNDYYVNRKFDLHHAIAACLAVKDAQEYAEDQHIDSAYEDRF
jgi:hypothetical protein